MVLDATTRLQRLLDVSTAVTQSLDTQAVTDAVIHKVSEALEAEACSLLLKQEDGDTLYFVSASGEAGDRVKRFTLQLGEGVAGLVAQTGEPILVQDGATDPRVSTEIARQVGVPVRSVICAPLRHDDRILGSIEVLNPFNRPAFDRDDLDMLRAITNILAIAIRNARRFTRLSYEVEGLQDALGLQRTIVGNSEAMQRIFRVVNRISATNVTILVTGETGTGKGLLARFIHDHSPRRRDLFVEVNCAAIPDTLVESELFGHERGAFTGATYPRKGKFELADGGTLYLDEIGDLSPQAQAKLLRAIEEQRFERVGSNDTIHTDVRIVATTNKHLEQAVEAGEFRSDLYYRLCQIPLHLPPLRERREDILLLAEHYLDQFQRQFGLPKIAFDEPVRQAFLNYPWPGNIRELINVVKRAVLLGEDSTIRLEHLPFAPPGGPPPVEHHPTLEMIERDHIARTLAKTGGVKKAAAALLGISRSTLDRKIAQYDIAMPEP